MKRSTILFFVFTVFIISYIFVINIKFNTLRLIYENKTNDTIVVIDPGHGGFDPGKVAINKALEKDINLSIANKLKSLLEFHDITVVMTREEDKDLSLSSRSSSEMKREDMLGRIRIINSSDAIIAISIHQNSFTQSSVKGAQVFYYNNSDKGKELAEIVQASLKETMSDGNHRLARPSSTYYILKNSKCPSVIVECGFLSNREEAENLCKEEYQDKIAWAIHLGIIDYLNKFNNKVPLAKK